jgi:hypothetical protein
MLVHAHDVEVVDPAQVLEAQDAGVELGRRLLIAARNDRVIEMDGQGDPPQPEVISSSVGFAGRYSRQVSGWAPAWQSALMIMSVDMTEPPSRVGSSDSTGTPAG